MRWIFWCLVVSNVVLLGWHFVFGDPNRGMARVPLVSPAATTVAVPPPGIVLVDELAGPLAGTSLEVAPEARHPALCKMVGPFEAQGSAEGFVARLAALDVMAEVHRVQLSAGESHWVYLPPERDRGAARRKLAELQGRGLDSYIIPKGELENGISLGVFSRTELALARQADLALLGLSAKIQSVERTYQEVWVMLKQGEEQKIAEKTWKELLHESFSLQEQQNYCLDVASRENIH